MLRGASNSSIEILQATQRPPLTRGATGTLDFPNSEDVRIEGWRDCRLFKLESSATCSCDCGTEDGLSPLRHGHLADSVPRASALSGARRIFQTHSDPPRERRTGHLPAPFIPVHAVLAPIRRTLTNPRGSRPPTNPRSSPPPPPPSGLQMPFPFNQWFPTPAR